MGGRPSAPRGMRRSGEWRGRRVLARALVPADLVDPHDGGATNPVKAAQEKEE